MDAGKSKSLNGQSAPAAVKSCERMGYYRTMENNLYVVAFEIGGEGTAEQYLCVGAEQAEAKVQELSPKAARECGNGYLVVYGPVVPGTDMRQGPKREIEFPETNPFDQVRKDFVKAAKKLQAAGKWPA